MQGSNLCITSKQSQTVADQYPELHFPDLALEKCVLDTAIAQNWTDRFEFTSLDCKDSANVIESVEGIGILESLERLNLSNSRVLDISGLSLANLNELILNNAETNLISRNSHSIDFNVLDVRGSSNIDCAILETWANAGVEVSADLCTRVSEINFEALAFDLVVNSDESLAFVSLPGDQSIQTINLAEFTIQDTWTLDVEPRGLDLSSDGNTLYAALTDTGELGYFDMSGTLERVDISALLDENRLGLNYTYDVKEISPDRIVVSSSPGSGGFAYLVEVRRDQMNAAKRVAAQQHNGEEAIIRTKPRISVTDDVDKVYVSVGSSMYVLDATQSNLPIFMHKYSLPADSIELDEDKGLLLSNLGQLIDDINYSVTGALSSDTNINAAFYSNDKAKIYTDGSSDGKSLRVFDSNNYRNVSNLPLSTCSGNNTNLIKELSSGDVLYLGDRSVCKLEIVSY